MQSSDWMSLVIALGLAACTHARQTPVSGTPDRHGSSADAAPEPTSTASASASTTSSVTTVVEPPPSVPGDCTVPVLQPGTCVPPLGDMEDPAIRAWLAARGVKVAEFAYEACREVAFGPTKEAVLVCTSRTPVVFDKTLGMAGPIERRRDVEIVTTKGTSVLELVHLPLAFGDLSLEDVLFSARYSVDAKNATLDLEVPAQECNAARANLVPYWDKEIAALRSNDGIEPAFKAALVKAAQTEHASDLVRINFTCNAAGHYVRGADGKLNLAK